MSPPRLGQQARPPDMRTSSNESSAVTEARSETFPWISSRRSPSPLSRRGSRGSRRAAVVVLAQTIATSARVPLVIQRLVPLRTQPLPSRRGRGAHAARVAPWSGSVRPKQPMILPLAISGSQRCFCSSVPKAWIGYMTSAPCTRGEAAQAGVAALELLHDQAVGDVVHARAAVALEVGAEDAQLGQLGHELHREGAGAEVLLDERQEAPLDELRHGAAGEPLLVGQQVVELEEVDAERRLQAQLR